MTASEAGSVGSLGIDRVTWTRGVVCLQDDRIFEFGQERHLERLVGRIMSVKSVRSVRLDRARSSLRIQHDDTPVDLIAKLSASIRNEADSRSSLSLPRGAREAISGSIFRHGAILTTIEVVSDRPGRLRLRPESLGADPDRACRLLETVKGVRAARIGGWRADALFLDYDPSVISSIRLVRLVEEAIEDPGGWSLALELPGATRFGLANANLGLAAVADFVLPVLIPASAILLVAANLRTFKAASIQIRTGKLGLSALYSVIVAATLLNGQFFASALMFWLFRFWRGRLGVELAVERKRVLDDCLPLPRRARLAASGGVEILVPSDRLRAGNQFFVGFSEAIAADARVIEGEAIVDERSVSGQRGTSRKRVGDRLFAGSIVLAGSIRAEVVQSADRTRASSIGRALIAATRPSAGSQNATILQGEAFANRAVVPTLATAGLGLLIGGLPTAGAILRPDYATGPGLSFPLEWLRDAAFCARRGVVVRQPDVFDRLSRADLIVIEDAPGLRRSELEVAGLRSSIPQLELLRLAASAFRHLADDRSTALAVECRRRGTYVLDVPAADFDPGVSIVVDRRKVRVREHFVGVGGEAGPLVVEIDGTTVGLIHFRGSSSTAGSTALQGLRERAGLPIVLVSDRSEADVSETAREIGAEVARGGLSTSEIAHLLRDCRARGLRVVYVGDCLRRPTIAAEAYVSISTSGEIDLDSDPASILLLQPRFELLADLWQAARSHADRVSAARKLVLLPNLVCVAGAFFFGATALTSVVVSSLGTFGVYSRAVGSRRKMGSSRESTEKFGQDSEVATAMT